MRIVVLLYAITAVASTRTGQAEERTSPLEEVSVLELVERVPALAMGHAATCSRRPEPGVRAYPALKSGKPVYGSVQFSGFFEEKDPARLYHFVADESGGSGTGYDRLYVDVNGDKDLSNDAPVSPRKDAPPELLQRYTSIVGQVLFEEVGIPLPFGAEGLRPLEVMPRLLLLKGDGAMLSFVPTKARRGRIEIGGNEYDVILGQIPRVFGWYDHPETGLYLTPPGGPTARVASAPSNLMSMPLLGETYYRFAASPAGDRLIVRPYEGPMGDFEIGGGKFKTAELTVAGTLRSRDAEIRLRDPTCRLPAGDYMLYSAKVSHGELEFAIQKNYHTDGGFRSRLYHVPTYPICIRAGERFILDFSHKPETVFITPAEGHRVKAGEQLWAQAVLTDPIADFVVYSLSRASRGSTDGSGKQPGSIRDTVLHPQVTISRSDGEVMTEGVMRYG
jgi:hypothetical protein